MEPLLLFVIAFGVIVLLLGSVITTVMIARDMSMGTDGSAILPMLGAAALSVVVVATVLFASKTYPSPLVPIVFAAAPTLVLIAFVRPILVCLLFVVFTYFRVHEVFPILFELNIPQFLAALSLLTLAWNLALPRSLTPYLTFELKLFLVFFAIVTIGVFFANDPQVAWNAWSDSYWKIGIMTLAIAWLARTPEDFTLAGRVWMLGGLLVAVVAILNKVAGIDLVEGSRVTIGRGNLGDPNDLALVLLFPLGFSTAALLYREKAFDTFLALLTTSAVIGAIIATQSRGGLLGLLAVLSVVGLHWTKSKTRLLILMLPVTIGLFFAADIGARFSGGSQEVPTVGLDESASGRLDVWGSAINTALARPLRGIGLTNFTTPSGLGAHSTWFQVLSETGFPGLVVFVALIIICWRRISSSVRTLNDLGAVTSLRVMALGLQAGLIGFCVSGSFLSQAFTWPLYIYVALISAVSHYTTLLSHARESEERTLHPVVAS